MLSDKTHHNYHNYHNYHCCQSFSLHRAASSAEFGNTSGGDPFGDTVVWEDAGEEGLVPRKISSPAAATAAVAAGSPTRTISSPQSQVR